MSFMDIPITTILILTLFLELYNQSTNYNNESSKEDWTINYMQYSPAKRFQRYYKSTNHNITE